MNKPSEVLTVALKSYKADDFMCHVLSAMYENGDVGYGLLEQTRDTFLPFIYGKGWGTLSNALFESDPAYKKTVETSRARGGRAHYGAAAYKRRLVWWKALIADLQSNGK